MKSSALIDIHCHLLPGIDDGAKTPSTTLSMAQMAVDSGVGKIICTPHCTAGGEGVSSLISRIQKATQILNYIYEQKQLPLTVYAGMELLCTEHLADALAKKEVLPLAGSRYLLIEFRFDIPLSRIEMAAEQVRRKGYCPVLAHPERYDAVQRDPECLLYWFDAGYVLQLDKQSIAGEFGEKCMQTAAWALRHGAAHIVASDAHGVHRRTTELGDTYRLVARTYGIEYADILMKTNPACILKNTKMTGTV